MVADTVDACTYSVSCNLISRSVGCLGAEHKAVSEALLLFNFRESGRICLEHDSYHGLPLDRSRLVLRPDRLCSILVDGDQSSVTPSAVRIEIVPDLGRLDRRFLSLDGNRADGFDIIDGCRDNSSASLDGSNCRRNNIVTLKSVKRLNLKDIRIIHSPIHILVGGAFRKYRRIHYKRFCLRKFLGGNIQRQRLSLDSFHFDNAFSCKRRRSRGDCGLSGRDGGNDSVIHGSDLLVAGIPGDARAGGIVRSDLGAQRLRRTHNELNGGLVQGYSRHSDRVNADGALCDAGSKDSDDCGRAEAPGFHCKDITF